MPFNVFQLFDPRNAKEAFKCYVPQKLTKGMTEPENEFKIKETTANILFLYRTKLIIKLYS